jgi:hypothetical protein
MADIFKKIYYRKLAKTEKKSKQVSTRDQTGDLLCGRQM